MLGPHEVGNLRADAIFTHLPSNFCHLDGGIVVGGAHFAGRDAELVMIVDRAPEESLELCCRAESLAGPGVEEQAVAVEVNGTSLDVWRFTRAQPRGIFRTVLPPAVWTHGRELWIVLRPAPASPSRGLATSSHESRTLSLALRGVQLRSRAQALPYALDRELQFKAEAEGLAALWWGWREPDASGCWSAGPEAELLMILDRIPEADVLLICRAEGMVGPALDEQMVAVEVNGVTLDPWRFKRAEPRGIVRTILPPSVWTRGRELQIVLRPAQPTSPRALGLSDDGRKLGVALQALRLRLRDQAFSYALGRELKFNNDTEDFIALRRGWAEPEAHGCWSIGPEAELVMMLDQVPEETLELNCSAGGLVGPGLEEQSVAVEVNGVALDTWRFTLAEPRALVRTIVPPSVWTHGRELRIVFRPARPTSPRALGLSEDPRKLGVRLTTFLVQPENRE